MSLESPQYRRLFIPAKEHLWTILATLIFLFVSKIASALDPLWLKKIIDQVSRDAVFSAIAPLLAVYFGLKVAASLFETLRDLAFAPAEMGIARSLSRTLFSHLLNLPIKYHHDQKIGGLSRQITRGTRAVVFILDFLVINILPTLAELGIVVYLLLKLYPYYYGLITLGTFVAYTWLTVWATEKRQRYRLGANRADDEVAGLEVDALTNIETIKYFNHIDESLKTYQPAIENRYAQGVRSNQIFGMISGAQGAVLLAGMGWILVLAIQGALAGALTIGDLVLLTTYVVRVSLPITTLGFVYRMIKDGLADLDGMARILSQPLEGLEPADPLPVGRPRGKVEFRKVSFDYSNARKILDNISFTVKPGEKAALVGSSGAGKSTIVKLLFSLYQPTKGEVLLDNIPQDRISLEDRKKLLAIVPQDSALFNTTLRENIRFGRPEAVQKEIEEAARLASLDVFVRSLPEGFDTVVGERGVKLSGGERQRVAIARAILRRPKVLVFDEATSSLDSKTEKDIQRALEAVSRGRTTIAIAHRLSTIVHFDTIYVLKGGKIVESGSHAKLMAQNGVYAKLWRLQAKKAPILAE